MNNAVFGKTMENRRKKELFNFKTKLSYNRIVFRKFMSKRNEKITDNHK